MSIADRDGFIWLDGELVPWREAKVHVLTHTLHYGMGVFEGIRLYETEKGPAVFRLADHVERLCNSARIYRMKLPFSHQDILEACLSVVRENKLTAGYIRPVCIYGADKMGLQITDESKIQVFIAAWPWNAYLGDEALEKGIRVKTSSYMRHHVDITLCKAKAIGNYTNSILAHQEAKLCGYDEALLLDPQGYVAEGSGENIFIVRHGELLTPDLSSCLEGLTRDTIIRLAQDAGLTVHEKRITRDEVYIADEAFFTGTAAEVTPICDVDARPIGNGVPGPITQKLQRLYFDQVHGKRKEYPEWFTFV